MFPLPLKLEKFILISVEFFSTKILKETDKSDEFAVRSVFYLVHRDRKVTGLARTDASVSASANAGRAKAEKNTKPFFLCNFYFEIRDTIIKCLLFLGFTHKNSFSANKYFGKI